MAYGPEPDGSYRLHGYKWFTSATDANMAFALARLANKDGTVIQVCKYLESDLRVCILIAAAVVLSLCVCLSIWLLYSM